MSSDQLGSLIPLVLIVAAAYLLLIRPARNRAKEVEALQRALTVGSDVLLRAGIYGTVVQIDEDRVQLEVSDGVVISVHRGAIGSVVSEVASNESIDDGHHGADDEIDTDPVIDPDPRVDPEPGSDPDSRGAH